jgi:DNA-binding response OmpR family regulator
LTPTELRMLECLMRNAQITISRDTLIERTWGFNFEGDTNRVDQYIRRLRKKIEANPHNPEFIHTVRGMGYVFRAPDTQSPVLTMPSLTDYKVAEVSEESRKLRYG